MRADEVAELRRIIDVASNCVGPCGRARAVRSSEAAGARTFVTSSAATVLKHWPVRRDHHVVQLVIDRAEAHLQRHCDGGWFFINLCLRVALSLLGLLVPGGSGGDSGSVSPLEPLRLPRASALRGLALASLWLDEAFEDERFSCRQKVRWSDLPSVLALLRSALCKSVALAAPEDVRHLSVTILEGFLGGLGPFAHDECDDEEGIRYSWFCGPEISWSSTEEGLLLDTPVSFSVPPPTGGKFRLVLFQASLEQWLPTATADSTAIGVERCFLETTIGGEAAGGAASVGDADRLRSWELAQFRRLADALVKAGIDVVACQKLVDPWLTDTLRHRGVTVLARLSLRHVEHVRRLSGAFPVQSLSALPRSWTDVCGVVGAIETRTIRSRMYTLVRPATLPTAASFAASAAASAPPQTSPAAPVVTLMLGAPDEHSLAEMRRCVPQAVHGLRQAARSGSVLVGAGLTEVHLADLLAERARGELMLPSGNAACDSAAGRAVLMVAACLRDVASCLVAERDPVQRSNEEMAGNVRHGPGPPASAREEFLETARATISQFANAHGNGCPTGCVLEALPTKISALHGALDLAGVILRLGGTLDFVNQSIG
mmetsp:Transcript_41932/g.115649  ORF Transcript_41932/g.115649 Transcript_41932/m.115649 type:complete len:603 (-) Transcript_41932:3-1811(-)